jgi:MFS family permease
MAPMGDTSIPVEVVPDAPAGGVWAPERRRLTAGLVLTVTLVAFESLAISTVLPDVSDDLGGLGLYGWVFSGFFLGSLLGIVVAGQMSDEVGTRRPYVLGLCLFAVGLAIGGASQSMAMLVVGRVAQGVGAGAIPAIAYAAVGRNYPHAIRPRVFAVFSSAWVIPGLIGPVAATTLAEAISWRAVFLALLPLVGLAAAISLPALSDVEDTNGEDGIDRRRDALILVVGTAAVLAGLGAGSLVLSVALVAAGVVPAVWAFLRLVPAGTARLVAGMPATVAVRGILTFAFFGADLYVSLAVTDGRDGSTWMAGAALTSGTLLWTSGAWIQQRIVHKVGPRLLVRLGFLLVGTGVVGMLVVLRSVPLWLSIPAWGVAGLGMGIAYSPLALTVLRLAPAGQEGAATASFQLADVLGVALGTGLSGVFVALGDGRGWATASSLTIAFTVMALVAVAGAFATGRIPRQLE